MIKPIRAGGGDHRRCAPCAPGCVFGEIDAQLQ